MTMHQVEYRKKLRTAREAVDLLHRDDLVAVPIATGQPAEFLAALGERDDWDGLRVFSGLFVEPYAFIQHPGVRCISGFFGPDSRGMIAAGAAIEYLPADRRAHV